MKSRVFILSIVLIAALLVGWYAYISSQAIAAVSVQRISVNWWGSAHADELSEAFTHWNEDDPSEVPVNCAKCHSGDGFLDYLGQDGSSELAVDEPAAVNSVITCEVCHNEQADTLEMAAFPSGIEVNLEAPDSLCVTCHSGTNSGPDVVNAIADYENDAIIQDASFINPHYAFAAATWLGSEAEGGFEYEGKTYAGRYLHADGVQTCTQCHDPHSLHIRQDYGDEANLCAACHSNVTGYSDYRDVYVDGIDYDGDKTVEGIFHEIEGLQQILYGAMQTYAGSVLNQPVAWADQYPYYFNDVNGNGELDEDEANAGNGYAGFSPRLMRTAFNYQFSVKDRAGYVHNGQYMLQLLYDAIEDLSKVVNVDMSSLVRPQ